VRKSILAKHLPYDSGHLGPVLDEMLLCGPPTIRCLRVGEWVFLALEGSHRLAAASALGLAPRLVVVRPEIEAVRRGPGAGPGGDWMMRPDQIAEAKILLDRLQEVRHAEKSLGLHPEQHGWIRFTPRPVVSTSWVEVILEQADLAQVLGNLRQKYESRLLELGVDLP
jgi:hypothetical protein